MISTLIISFRDRSILRRINPTSAITVTSASAIEIEDGLDYPKRSSAALDCCSSKSPDGATFLARSNLSWGGGTSLSLSPNCAALSQGPPILRLYSANTLNLWVENLRSLRRWGTGPESAAWDASVFVRAFVQSQPIA